MTRKLPGNFQETSGNFRETSGHARKPADTLACMPERVGVAGEPTWTDLGRFGTPDQFAVFLVERLLQRQRVT